MNEPFLSVITPVFNGFSCIRRCLDAIYSLPLCEDGFEVIIVDDCSTDNTLEILNDYASKHSNMVVLHQEVNLRQGAARNRGIDIAKGEYIAFCDADDMIVADGVMNALKAVSETKADICYFDFEYETSDGAWQVFEMPKETRNTILSASDYLNNYYTCYYNAPWRNLYRTDFLRKTGVRFVEGVRWEDCDWTVKVYAHAKTIQFVDGVGYRYFQNGTNTCSQSQTPSAMAEQLFAGLRLLRLADELCVKFPHLAVTLVDEARSRYVVGILRLRNLSKYSVIEVSKMYSFLGEAKRKALGGFKFNKWISFTLKHRFHTLFVLSFVSPLARVGRFLVSLIRTES